MRGAYKLGCLLWLLWLVTGSAEAEPLAYEPREVTLSGHIVRHTFPGPPNYESIRHGDAKERAWLLVLHRPVTVVGDPASELNTATERDQRRMQVVCLGPKAPAGWLVGPEVTIKGTLYHASTGHHHTPVMLRAIDIQADGRGWHESSDR